MPESENITSQKIGLWCNWIFVALTAVCTHEACTVSGFQSSRYVCPCHGSQYSTTGAVLQGPATRSLQQFATRISGTVLTISL